MKISPAVPLGAAGAKNLEFLPKNQFFTIKNYIFSDFGGGFSPQSPQLATALADNEETLLTFSLQWKHFTRLECLKKFLNPFINSKRMFAHK